jgi:signal transduction histidine kinase
MREVKAIYDEEVKSGVLIAKNIADMNLKQFQLWDKDGIRNNIRDQISLKLVYVIFYDLNKKPFAANDFITKYEDIYRSSRLKGDVTEGSYFHEKKTLVDEKTGQVLRILEVEIPIFAKGPPIRWGSIKIGLSMEEMLAEIHETRRMLVLTGCVGLFIGVVGATLLARGIAKPLSKLLEGTEKIAKGELAQKINITSKDEIGDLAQSFNDMSRQLFLARERMEEANTRLIQAEKLASIGRISAGIAHEIRNPLTSVKLNIQKLFQSPRLNETEKEHLGLSQEGISQMEKFIKDFLDFTRVSELNLDLFSIEQILDESVKMMSDSFELKKIVLEKNYQKEMPQVLVDGDKMRQVFLNILRNAYEAVNEGGIIKITVGLVKEEGEKRIKVEIADNGCGIPQKDKDIVFEPFYTTKSSGIGLGLANARKITGQHMGSIQIKESGEKGTSFEILIPVKEKNENNIGYRR